MDGESEFSLEKELKDSSIPWAEHLSYTFVPLGFLKSGYLRKTRTAEGIHYTLVDNYNVLAREIKLTDFEFHRFRNFMEKYIIEGINWRKALDDVQVQVQVATD